MTTQQVLSITGLGLGFVGAATLMIVQLWFKPKVQREIERALASIRSDDTIGPVYGLDHMLDLLDSRNDIVDKLDIKPSKYYRAKIKEWDETWFGLGFLLLSLSFVFQFLAAL